MEEIAQVETKAQEIIEPYKPYYCGNCGLPIEYCRYGSRSETENCRQYLKEDDPEMYAKIYSDDLAMDTANEIEENKETEEQIVVVDELTEKISNENGDLTEEEKKIEEEKEKEIQNNNDEYNAKKEKCHDVESDDDDEDDEDEDEEAKKRKEEAIKKRLEEQNSGFKFDFSKVPQFGIPTKNTQAKSWKPDPENGILQIRMAMRGKKKGVTQVWGYHDFPEAVENMDKIMKELKIKCASAVAMQDIGVLNNEECLAIQGNVVQEVIKVFTKIGKVPVDQIYLARDGKIASKKKAKYAAMVAAKKDNGKTEDREAVKKALAAPAKPTQQKNPQKSQSHKPSGNIPHRSGPVNGNNNNGNNYNGTKTRNAGSVNQRNTGASYTAKRY